MHLSLAYIVELLKPNYIMNFHIICGQKHYILFFPLSCIIFTNISFSSILQLSFQNDRYLFPWQLVVVVVMERESR